MKILNVAEKNDAAKAIAALLSGGNVFKKDGKSKFNKIYEFKCNINGRLNDMLMTSVSGHMMNYEFPIHMKNWMSVNPGVLFDCIVNKVCTDNMKNVKESLEQLIRHCNMLVIWTDCDREGENIGMEIVDTCLAVNPNIIVKRARFSEITYQSVTRAVNNLVEINLKLSQAVDVRQELDLKLGAAFTRLQTLFLQKKFPHILSNQVISYGSCQFPTLGFVVERYKEVENFISEPFWKIKLHHEKKLEVAEFSWDRIKLFDENVVRALLDNITDGGSLACVIDVSNKPKSKWRPFAMDTIELEKLASRKLRINPKTTMQIAEKLYSKGYISYPRTETNIFPKDMNLHKLVEAQVSDPRWGEFAVQLIPDGINPHNGKKSDQAHPPIHPLKQGLELTGDESRIFELITRHFLACLSKNAVGHETKILIDCISKPLGSSSWRTLGTRRLRSGLGEGFSLTGLAILERNYLEVYPYDKWSDKEVPNYEIGEIFEPTSLSIEHCDTSPPSLLTEADLISLMDKHGIGTDATHAEHIDKVKTRDYVGNTGPAMNYLIPGKLGMGLVEGYDLMGFFLARPNLRSKFEADLELICQGIKQPREVLSLHLNEYKAIFSETVTQIEKLQEGVAKFLGEAAIVEDNPGNTDIFLNPISILQENIRGCPICDGMVIIRKSAKNAWFLGCTKYPACKHTLWLPNTVENVVVAKCRETGSLIMCPNSHEHDHNLPVYKISLKFNINQASIGYVLPDEDRNFVVCLYCNKEFCESLNIRFHTLKPLIALSNQSSIPSNYSVIPPHSKNSEKAPHSIKTELKKQSISQCSFEFSTSTFPTESKNLHDMSSKATPVCHCGQLASIRKVSKEGPNKDKFFYTCSISKCQMFAWADDGETVNKSQHKFNQLPASIPPQNTRTNPLDVNCKCGKPALLLTVKKETQNKGRQFYSCSKCNFFQWSDESGSKGDVVVKYSKKRPFQSPKKIIGSKKIISSENVWPPPVHVSKAKSKSIRCCTICRQPGHTAKNCLKK